MALAAKSLTCLLLVCGFCLPLPVHSASQNEEAVRLLAELLSKQDGVRANFSQTLTNATGEILEVSNGSLLLAKPNFRWEIESPFPQTIVTSEDTLSIYDPDLMQLSVQKMDERAGYEVPLKVLTSPSEEALGLFDVVLLDRSSSQDTQLTRFSLVPRGTGALFAQLLIVFQDQHLQSFSIVDHAGQEALVQMITYESGLVLESSSFQLEVPPGTDVIEG